MEKEPEILKANEGLIVKPIQKIIYFEVYKL